MRFYWFGRTDVVTLDVLSEKLENAGFHGLLLPYAARYRNFFIDIARHMKKDQSLKYIVAIRPYTISPQFLSNTIKALNEIDDDRVWINFVSGQVAEREKEHGGIIGEVNDSTDPLTRKRYLLNYVKVFNDFYEGYTGKPVVCISGMSEEIFDITEKYGDYNFLAYEPYSKNNYRRISKPRVVSMCPFIRDTQEEIDSLDLTDTPQDIVYTTEENLIGLIKSLKEDGIEDVMFFSHGEEEEMDRIVEFVKKNKNLF